SLAGDSGGRYVRATLGPEDIQAVLPPPDVTLFSGEGRSEKEVPREFGSFLLLSALLILLIARTLKIPGIIGILLLVCAYPLESFAQDNSKSLYDGYKAYNNGEYEEAAAIFEEKL